MKIIVSHTNLDFDGLASIVAANLLNPSAIPAIAPTQSPPVRAYLDLYCDRFPLLSYTEVDWKNVTSILFVDCSSEERAGLTDFPLTNVLKRETIDHHSSAANGANITSLIETIRTNQVSITADEATLFGLGLYSDTGSFLHPNTSSSDLEAAAFLLNQGMNFEAISFYLQQTSNIGANPLFSTLMDHLRVKNIKGIDFGTTTAIHPDYIPNVSLIADELMRLYCLDAIVVCCQLKKHTYIVARAQSKQVNVQKIAENFGGGGHPQAASAVLKHQSLSTIEPQLNTQLENSVDPPLSVKTCMSWPVQTLEATTTVDQAWKEMLKFGHSGFPVCNEENKVIGIVSKSDLIKARQLEHGNIPIRGIMVRKVVTITQHESIQQAQKTFGQLHIGRLPVVDDKKQIVGIITRSDLIDALYAMPDQVDHFMLQNYFNNHTLTLLKRIGVLADEMHISVFLVGGVVRDLFLNRPHADIDLVVEGDAIAFAKQLSETFGGTVQIYETFGTATWRGEIEIDVVTCRKEFYSAAGALPQVKTASITEDLARRDFSINAIAMYINASRYGEIVDVFEGKEDLMAKRIRILHPLSFKEDPTRLFRAVRFALRLGFQIDADTVRAAKQTGKAIRSISPQRFHNELIHFEKEAMLLDGFIEIEKLGVWETFFGHPLTNDAFMHMKQLVFNQHEKAVFLLLAAAKDSQTFKQLAPYMLTKQEQTLFDEVQRPIWDKLPLTIGEIHRELAAISKEAIVFHALAPDGKKKFLLDYIEKRSRLQPLLKGNDLKKAGLQPGPSFSKWLFELECLQLDEKISTVKEALDWINTQ